MIRILLVDDQNIVRQGLQALLEPRPRLKVVGTAKDGKSAIEQVEALRPDVVLIDLEMPVMNGITATRRICQQFTSTKVLILSSHENQEYVAKALQAGAGGYLLKSTLADDLEQAIWSVHRGHSQLESKLLKKVLAEASLSQSITSVEQSESTSVEKKLVQETSLELHSDVDDVSNINNNKYLQKIEESTAGSKNVSSSKIAKNSLKPVFEPAEFKIGKTSDKNRKKFEQVESLPAKNHQVRLLWLFLSLAILCGGSASWLWLEQNYTSVPIENESPSAIPVRLQELSVSTIKNSSEFVGALEAQQRVSLRPETDGRIVEILVSSGERVQQGTPLIQLRPDKNRAQLNSVSARIVSLKAVLNQAESELEAAEAEQSSAAAELQLQKEEFKRTSFLVTAGAQSTQDLERVKRDRSSALATFEAAQKRVEATKAAIDKANADIQQAEADANLEQENLRDTEVVAPVAGTIGDIPVKIGDYVETTNTLTRFSHKKGDR